MMLVNDSRKPKLFPDITSAIVTLFTNKKYDKNLSFVSQSKAFDKHISSTMTYAG